uniref:Uncharacterized protein n=1 Tax=Globodera rostochiensis TaxID=31243 RepID=A0A914HV90_GLORO
MFARLCAPMTLIGALIVVQLIEYGRSDTEAFREVRPSHECQGRVPKCVCGWAKCAASKGAPASDCCDEGYAFKCCATTTPTFEWKPKTTDQLINELKAKGKQCKSGQYCMCGFVLIRAKLAGLCCYNDTDSCQCCKTELSIPSNHFEEQYTPECQKEMKTAEQRVNYQCKPRCVRSEDWPPSACCAQNYRLQCCDPYGQSPETDPCALRAVLCKADDKTCKKKKDAQGKLHNVRHISNKWTNEETIDCHSEAAVDCVAAKYSKGTTPTTTQSPAKTNGPKRKTGTKMPSTIAANGTDVSAVTVPTASGMPPKRSDDLSLDAMRCTTMNRCYPAILERQMLGTLGKSYQFKSLYTVRRRMTEQVNSNTLQCVHVLGCSTGLFTEFVLDDFFMQKGAFMDEYIKLDNNLC